MTIYLDGVRTTDVALDGTQKIELQFSCIVVGFVTGIEFEGGLNFVLPENSMYMAVI